MQNGIPVQTMTELLVAHRCDPIEASVVWGFLPAGAVPDLNYEAIVMYAPTEVLAAELKRRVDVYTKTRPDSARKTTVGMLRRA